MMAQYCRYCNNMVCGDANYCSLKQEIYSDSQICRTNKCKYFELNPICALTGKEYSPRKFRGRDGKQLQMEDNT